MPPNKTPKKKNRRTSVLPTVPPHRAPKCAAAFASELRAGGRADRLFSARAKSYLWAQNVVTKTWLVQSVELRKYSGSRPNAYVPSQFFAIVVRTKNQQGSTCLVFRTGRVVVVGTHSLSQTYQAAHRLRMSLSAEAGGIPTKFEEFRLVNMVFNTKVKADHGIAIANIHRDNQDKTEWVPTMFPGLKYSMAEEHVKMRFFDTGELVGMGVTNPSHVRRIFGKAMKLASDYPDYQLPASNERFEYRKNQKRRALVDIATNKLGTETDVEETEVEEPQTPLL